MKSKKTHSKRGFTIIEVVMVLAIAGMIFAVVFAAVPRLQTSRRDNQRKRDAEAITSAIVSYQSNNKNIPSQSTMKEAFPNSGSPQGRFQRYATNSKLEDPTTQEMYVLADSVSSITVGQFYYNTGVICSDARDDLESGHSDSDWALLMYLERGRVCYDTKG